MGNGLLTFVDEKVQMNDFFTKNEIIFYKNINDLSDKIKFYAKNDNLRKKIAKNGKQKYFKLFNETKIAKYFIDISVGKINKLFSNKIISHKYKFIFIKNFNIKQNFLEFIILFYLMHYF